MTIMEHVNGRGRLIPSLPEHTFKDSGITIRIRKIGPTTQQRLAHAILKDIPEPPIPVVKTELGEEPNAADPSYTAAHEAWRRATNTALSERLMLLAALEAEVTIGERERADIARRKRNMQLAKIPYEENPDLSDDENERVFFIMYVAAASPEDLREFGDAVLRRSVPTEEAVQEHLATFPGDV